MMKTLKKPLSIMLSLLLLFGAATTVHASAQTTNQHKTSTLFGDANEDGSVDAKDASFILVAYAKASTGSEDGLTDTQRVADFRKRLADFVHHMRISPFNPTANNQNCRYCPYTLLCGRTGQRRG